MLSLFLCSEVIECCQPIGPLSQKYGIYKTDANGKPSNTTFERISFDGKTSIVKCWYLVFIVKYALLPFTCIYFHSSFPVLFVLFCHDLTFAVYNLCSLQRSLCIFVIIINIFNICKVTEMQIRGAENPNHRHTYLLVTCTMHISCICVYMRTSMDYDVHKFAYFQLKLIT